jgi:V/A-type H+-transporting ATPase subunit E
MHIMSEKLRLLTEKIYEEGIEKAKSESEKLIANARAEADRILKDAQKEKENIINQAAAEAESARRKVEAEIKLAAVKAGNQLRSNIENLLASEQVNKPLTQGLSDPTILKEVLVNCVSALRKSEEGDWTIALSREAEKQIQSWMSDTRAQALQNGIEFNADGQRGQGFKVISKSEGYALEFDAASFERFLGKYLKPETLQLLTSEA